MPSVRLLVGALSLWVVAGCASLTGPDKPAPLLHLVYFKLLDPASFAGTIGAWKRGYRVGIPGRRTNQLGATFVIGPGDELRYQHRDAHTADHAPMEEIFSALAEEH